MGLMSFGLSMNDEITVIVSGEDEPEAMKKIEGLIENNFKISL
jgi:phosphotransferase system HPr-like phosphotransfer protein